jgi:hypothetical protein
MHALIRWLKRLGCPHAKIGGIPELESGGLYADTVCPDCGSTIPVPVAPEDRVPGRTYRLLIDRRKPPQS